GRCRRCLLHARQQLHRVGLVVAQAGLRQGTALPGLKVVPYCPRCGTALSSHEVALGYKDVLDPSVFVRFPVKGEEGVSLLGWTTTPWTLLSNAALAVRPDVTYARTVKDGETFILAESLV